MPHMKSTTVASKTISRRARIPRLKKEAPASAKVDSPLQTSNRNVAIAYVHDKGVDDFVEQVDRATPMQLIEAERNGVDGRFLKDLSKRIDMPADRVFTMLGLPKATDEKKAMQNALVSGSGGQAAIAVAKLLGKAKSMVENSTSLESKDFDSAKWLGQWLERAQPALGGRKPADLIITPTGVEIVTRLLGAIESGAIQ
jgi:putative toxin-antitoxin system antitoxin component (TIGR02293 family)